MTKICKKCGIEKELSEYYKGSAGYYRSDCKDCINKESRLQKAIKRAAEGKVDRRLTPEQHLAKCIETHGNKFIYDLASFKGVADKINIYCTEHEEHFQQALRIHTSGGGCKTCARQKAAATIVEDNSKTFLKRLEEIHGIDKFGLQQTVYSGRYSEVKIECKTHGLFTTTADSLLMGHGCTKCAHEATSKRCRSNTEAFVKKANSIHGAGTFCYKLVNYTTNYDYISVGCKTHGYFQVKPAHHFVVSTGGCPECSERGYKSNRKGYLYILESDGCIKVGITNNTPDRRLKQINKTCEKKFECIKSYYFEDGKIPQQAERVILNVLRLLYKNPDNKFDGYTETFLLADKNLVIKTVEFILKDLLNAYN